MQNRSTPDFWGFNNSVKRKVGGLRDSAPPGEVKVYKANPDWSKGELLRIETPEHKVS